jgi:hypothetical protein
MKKQGVIIEQIRQSVEVKNAILSDMDLIEKIEKATDMITEAYRCLVEENLFSHLNPKNK